MSTGLADYEAVLAGMLQALAARVCPHKADSADAPFSDQDQFPDACLIAGIASYQQLCISTRSFALAQPIAAPEQAPPLGLVDFDADGDLGCFTRRLRHLAGGAVPEDWWITRQESLGRSPLSALANGEYEPVRELVLAVARGRVKQLEAGHLIANAAR